MSTSDFPVPPSTHPVDRRTFMGVLAGLGVGGTAFPAALWAEWDQQGEITTDTIACAERVAGLEFTDEEREMMVRGLNGNLNSYREIRATPLPNGVHPAIRFDPLLPGHEVPTGPSALRHTRPTGVQRPESLEDLAFAPLSTLAELIRARQITSMELTEMYLGRLERYGPRLESVITLTRDLAVHQAARADEEIARGMYRGPLHGIPWGAKDLLAEDAYRTTWGAKPFEDQMIAEDATVVRRLEEAGAVLVAKLTLGALAMGDYWYGGRTRNPWNLEQGSSGSSAGSAASVAAGLVGFAIGSETLGSIVSPSTRCGASGLRPTFGRVSRYGAMALSWTMDKLGPICRHAEDCALVFSAIHGADGYDPTARDAPFDWDVNRSLADLRIGYLRSAFETEPRPTGSEQRDRIAAENHALDVAALDHVRQLGATLIPVELPTNDELPVNSLRIILNAEAGAAFDELTRSGRDDLLVRQQQGAWPNSFRQSRLIPAVEYIQANRIRTMLMGMVEARLEGIDVFATPSFGGNVLLTTNLTGHPAVVVPSGFRENGTPVSISFIGKLFGDADALRVAKAFQDITDFHARTPPGF